MTTTIIIIRLWQSPRLLTSSIFQRTQKKERTKWLMASPKVQMGEWVGAGKGEKLTKRRILWGEKKSSSASALSPKEKRTAVAARISKLKRLLEYKRAIQSKHAIWDNSFWSETTSYRWFWDMWGALISLPLYIDERKPWDRLCMPGSRSNNWWWSSWNSLFVLCEWWLSSRI